MAIGRDTGELERAHSGTSQGRHRGCSVSKRSVTTMSTHHLLIVANETVEGTALVEAARDIALSHDAEVFVVAPALNTRLRHWMSDSDGARAAAEARLAGCLARLREAGVRAAGE